MNNERNIINPGTFGSGVIGKEAFEKEQQAVADLTDVFGPGVTGKEEVPNVTGPGVAEQKREDGKPPVPPMLALRALKDALDASPLLVDTFLAVELNRPDGPRRGAVALLGDAERKRPGGPRDDILAQLGVGVVEEAETAPVVEAPAEDPAPAEGTDLDLEVASDADG